VRQLLSGSVSPVDFLEPSRISPRSFRRHLMPPRDRAKRGTIETLERPKKLRIDPCRRGLLEKIGSSPPKRKGQMNCDLACLFKFRHCISGYFDNFPSSHCNTVGNSQQWLSTLIATSSTPSTATRCRDSWPRYPWMALPTLVVCTLSLELVLE
jgi:hypothetical protein